MRVSFTRHDGPADFELSTRGRVVVSELSNRASGLTVRHKDGSSLDIIETDDGFIIRHWGEDEDRFYSSSSEFKNAWPTPPVTTNEGPRPGVLGVAMGTPGDD